MRRRMRSRSFYIGGDYVLSFLFLSLIYFARRWVEGGGGLEGDSSGVGGSGGGGGKASRVTRLEWEEGVGWGKGLEGSWFTLPNSRGRPRQ